MITRDVSAPVRGARPASWGGVLACALVGSWSPADARPSLQGQWGPVLDWDGLVAVHAVHLPDGYILVWRNGSNPRVWDAYTETFFPGTYPLGANIFCGGHAHLVDGSAMVIGGHGSGNGDGIPLTEIFRWPNPGPDPWQTAGIMAHGRWYPTCTALSDGKILATSGLHWPDGQQSQAKTVGIPELYDPFTDTWQELTGADKSLSLYPLMFLMPTGEVFYAGPSSNPQMLNVEQEQWGTTYPSSFAGETAVMYRPGEVMKCGGGVSGACVGDPKMEDDTVGSPKTAVFDLNAASPAWQDVQDMVYARRRHNLTILADGTVLAAGGTGCEDNAAFAVRAAELFDPASNTWSEMASTNEDDPPRMYHSIGLLLPDGRVLTAGGDGQPSAQIFSPPYLFRGPRPQITAVPRAMAYGSSFALITPEAQSTTMVNLHRLGSVTHAFNQDQRCVPLTFQSLGGNTLTVTAPLNGNHAPPGYYMLFTVSSAGVPSMAEYVQVKSHLTDVNCDCVVNVLDLIDLLLCFGQPAVSDCQMADVNQDGAVNVLDLIGLLLDFSAVCP